MDNIVQAASQLEKKVLSPCLKDKSTIYMIGLLTGKVALEITVRIIV